MCYQSPLEVRIVWATGRPGNVGKTPTFAKPERLGGLAKQSPGIDNINYQEGEADERLQVVYQRARLGERNHIDISRPAWAAGGIVRGTPPTRDSATVHGLEGG